MGRRDGERLTAAQMRDQDRLVERFERRPEPISIPLQDVEATGRLHEGDGTRVRVCVQFKVSYVLTEEVEATVIAWTPRAVKIRAKAPDGHSFEAWVWAGAVRRAGRTKG